MKQPDLLTKRLILRSFTVDDARDVQRLAGNFNVAKMTLNIPHPYENGMAEEWISSHKDKSELGVELNYAIVSLKLGILLGAISLIHIESTQSSMGYWIGEEYWSKGYCTEAGIALIDHAFITLSLKRIYALHLSSNPASGKVMEKMGMKHYNTEIRADRFNKPASVEFYEIEST